MIDIWRKEFSNLYNGLSSDESGFDQNHYTIANSHKQTLELNMMDPIYNTNEQLNEDISLEEVTRVVMSARSLSATGTDKLPYATMKFPPVIAALQCFFQLVFDTSIIPLLWRKSVICPLLKDPNSDRRVPLNYRGISLLSCVSKLYSAVINKRLRKYMENNRLLADEQNGFRSGRSCVTIFSP